MKMEVSELNRAIQRLQAEIANLKKQVGHQLGSGGLWGKWGGGLMIDFFPYFSVFSHLPQ